MGALLVDLGRKEFRKRENKNMRRIKEDNLYRSLIKNSLRIWTVYC